MGHFNPWFVRLVISFSSLWLPSNLAGTAGGCAGAAALLDAAIAINNPDYVSDANILFAYYLIFVFICTFLNIFAKHALPIVSTWISYLVIITWLMFLIWPTSRNAGSLYPVDLMFSDFYDGTGWNNGVVYLIAMLPAA